MRQRPGPDELERLAAAILGDDPLPEDPKARSYEQRLALKALTVSEFDREHSAADMTEELSLFEKLWGKTEVEASGLDEAGRIAALNRRLAVELRAGEWDAAPRALRELLMAQVRARLARSNPKYLKARMPDV